MAGIGVVGGVTYVAGTLWGITTLGLVPLLFTSDLAGTVAYLRRSRRVVGRVEAQDGPLLVRGRDARHVKLTQDHDGSMALSVSTDAGRVAVTGSYAPGLLMRLLPVVNRWGGNAREVSGALRRIDDAGGPAGLIRRCARSPRGDGPQDGRMHHGTIDEPGRQWSLGAFQVEDLLALEIALHEEQERRAMEGELAVLAEAWREAEEIAAIADDLLVPRGVRDALARLGPG
jgi:hypothetical protein